MHIHIELKKPKSRIYQYISNCKMYLTKQIYLTYDEAKTNLNEMFTLFSTQYLNRSSGRIVILLLLSLRTFQYTSIVSVILKPT